MDVHVFFANVVQVRVSVVYRLATRYTGELALYSEVRLSAGIFNVKAIASKRSDLLLEDKRLAMADMAKDVNRRVDRRELLLHNEKCLRVWVSVMCECCKAKVSLAGGLHESAQH